jgi:hypothetical protein
MVARRCRVASRLFPPTDSPHDGLNITRVYARHLYTCRTRLSAFLPHLILATVFRYSRLLVPDVKPCHSSIIYAY